MDDPYPRCAPPSAWDEARPGTRCAVWRAGKIPGALSRRFGEWSPASAATRDLECLLVLGEPGEGEAALAAGTLVPGGRLVELAPWSAAAWTAVLAVDTGPGPLVRHGSARAALWSRAGLTGLCQARCADGVEVLVTAGHRRP